MAIESIVDDKRAITWIRFPPSGPHDAGDPVLRASADSEYCTAIVAYQEMGEMAPVTWFAQMVGDVVVARHNGKYIDSVGYR